jgi:hypothetical protein
VEEEEEEEEEENEEKGSFAKDSSRFDVLHDTSYKNLRVIGFSDLILKTPKSLCKKTSCSICMENSDPH